MTAKLPVRPVRDQILVKPEEAVSVTKSGFHIPSGAAEKVKGKLRFGTILAQGPGIRVNGVLEPMETAVGDRIVLEQYGPKEFRHLGENYLIAPQYDVLAIIT